MNVRTKAWLARKGGLCFGTGRAAILRAVQRTGSLSGAARELQMSYRHAWSSIRVAEQRLGRRLLVRRRGGPARGGAALTPCALRLLGRFERLDRDIRDFADQRFAALFGQTGKGGGKV